MVVAAPSAQTNSDKFIATYHAIAIKIKLVYHREQLVLLQAFTQLSSHSSQIVDVDFALAGFIEELEGSQDLIPRVSRQYSLGSDCLECSERNHQPGRADDGRSGRDYRISDRRFGRLDRGYR